MFIGSIASYAGSPRVELDVEQGNGGVIIAGGTLGPRLARGDRRSGHLSERRYERPGGSNTYRE